MGQLDTTLVRDDALLLIEALESGDVTRGLDIVRGLLAMAEPERAPQADGALTLEQFILRNVGTGMDFDGRFGYQCVDLYRYYLRDVLNIPQSPPVVGAADIWTNPPPECVKIPNTPTNIPLPGDIVVWSRAYGPFGHVAVFYLGDVMKFVSFDQNLPTGTIAHLQHHTYANVLGWLRIRP